MTFRQLVIKNLLANIRRYVAYFLCVLFSMTVFFLFSAIWFVPDFTQQTSAGMRQIIIIGWTITVLFSIFLISYAHNQFSKARSREFGVLLSYGLLHRDIRNMVVLENITIYLAALLGAVIGGGIFSRLFFMITTTMLGIENIEFSLTLNSVILTAVSFVPVLSMVMLLTLVKTRKMTVISLVNDMKQTEMKKTGRLELALIGFGMMVVTLAALYRYTSDPANTINMQQVILSALILSLIGLYLFISNFGSIFYLLLKDRGEKYYAHLLNLSEFSHRYRQNRTIIFILCMLSLGAVMFTSLSYTLYSQTYWVVEQEQLPDVMFKEFAVVNLLSGIDYEQILSQSDAAVIEKDKLDVVYLLAPEIMNDNWRPNRWVPVSSVEQYNKIFNEAYDISRNSAITIVYNRMEEDGRAFFDQDILLESSDATYTFAQLRTEYTKIFDRYAFGQPVLVLVHDDDYTKLYREAEDTNRGKIHMYAYDDWTKSGAAIEALMEEFKANVATLTAAQPEQVEAISQRHPGAFDVISKYARYQHNKQVSGFALFIMGFISLLFMVAICILIYFKILSDYEADRKKLAMLSTVGITSTQMKRYLSGKLKMIMLAPIILGSLLGIGFSLALNLSNVVEMEISNGVIFSNALLVTAIYWAAMLLYYHLLKQNYYRSLLD